MRTCRPWPCWAKSWLTCGTLALLGAATAHGPALAVEADDFVVEDASTLVELCDASPDDQYYTQAIHMCHGFISGVAQYSLLLFEAAGGGVICFPDPAPTRSDAIADFVTWMGEHPDFASVEGPEAVVRYLQETFPCP